MSIIIKLIAIGIISIFLLNIQVWIIGRLFPSKEEKRKVLWYTLLMGAVVASLLLAFTYVIQPYIQNLASQNNIFYSAFIALTWGIIAITFAAKRQWLGVFFISTITVLAIITGAIELFLTSAALGLVILKAAWEEVLKTASSQSLATHATHFKSDVIIFSILAWIGFALFENIVYFLASWSRGQFIVRSITSSLLHWIFTWCIWYILRKWSKASYISYIAAYWVGIWLHALYNISLTQAPLAWWLVFVIGWYFLLTYLLYKSDSIYVARHD